MIMKNLQQDLEVHFDVSSRDGCDDDKELVAKNLLFLVELR